MLFAWLTRTAHERLRKDYYLNRVPKKLGEQIIPRVNTDQRLTQRERNYPMLWTIIVILLVLWLLGLLGHVGGSLIHLLLVIAVIVLIINLVQGRRGL